MLAGATAIGQRDDPLEGGSLTSGKKATGSGKD